MTPEQYQTLRARSSLSLITALRPLTRLLRPRPSPAQWQAWVQSAYPAVYRARVEQWEHAQQFYLEERARFGDSGPTPVPLRDYAPQALDTGLQERNVLSRLDALEDDDPVPTVIIDDTLAVAERHGAAAGRDAIVDAARHDRRALGYARTTVGLENCAFCLMLVSRGPVYKDENTALYRDGSNEPYHDNCVPAGTVVHGPSVDVAYRRLYEGELLVVETASGRKLSITPNHPVLTNQGWVPAGRLDHGSYVVGGLRADGMPPGVPHEHHGESLIEDVWGSLSVSASTGMPGSTEDFHGDGTHHQVDVVLADRFLRDRVQSTLLEQRLHGNLSTAGRLRGSLSGLCLFHQSIMVGGNSTRGRVGGLSLAKTFLRGHGRSSLLSSLAVSADGDPGLLQTPADHRSGHTVLPGQADLRGPVPVPVHDLAGRQVHSVPTRFDPTGSYGTAQGRLTYSSRGRSLRQRLSGDVELDRVVHLRRVSFSGHVYNLRTSEGWYSADGVIVSNCDCIPVPVYSRDDWPGRDEYLEMEAAWQEHGGDLLHWRRYVEDRVQPEAEPPAT